MQHQPVQGLARSLSIGTLLRRQDSSRQHSRKHTNTANTHIHISTGTNC